jgi:cytochrome c oxidase subunit 2
VGITASAERNTNHSTMLADLHVVTRESYDTLLREGPPMPSECEGAPNPNACWGEKLYGTLGCRSCHSTDASVQVPAPSWDNLFGHTVELEGGGSVVVDENYIRESILQPQAKIVAGFATIRMPPANPPEKQLQAIIAYIQSLAE